MAYDHLREQFRDVAVTTATPFTDGDREVDHGALRSNLAALEERGVRLFVACGNTGEYHALTPAERAAVVATHVAATDEDATVVGGVGGSRRAVLEEVAACEAAGADAVMVMYPGFTYAHERGLVDYYEAVAGATDLGVVLYRRGPAVSRRVIAGVADRENVVAVKFAEDDLAAFAESVAAVDADLAWVNGLAERYAPAFAAAGAVGYTTGIGNFAPRATLALFDALEAGDRERAREIRDRIAPYEALRQETGPDNDLPAANNVPAVKYGMDLAGLDGGAVRPPLVALSGRDRERAAERYARFRDAG